MELEEVHVVGLEHAQTGLDAAHHGRAVACAAGLGGDINVVTHLAQGVSDFLLAVRVAARGVVKVDPALIGPAEDGARRVKIDALDGQRAKSGA
jgi:hypothetical protein